MNKHEIAIVTGAGGFLGQYVAQKFSGEGWSVIGVDCVSLDDASGKGLTAYYQTTLPSASLREIIVRHAPSVCIHCAGASSVGLSIENPGADFYAGPVVTFELLETLRQFAPACRLVYLSSAAVYGNPDALPISESQRAAPISPYGFHKFQCEQLCAEYAKVYGLRTASARIFSAYGPGLRRQVLWDICRSALRDRKLMLQGTGNESRDFIHAKDIAKGLGVIAASAPMQGEFYNLASGRETTIRDLVRLLIAALDIECPLQFDGIHPVGVPLNWRADIGRIQALGFEPSIALSAGVESFVNWCRSGSA